MKLTDGHVLAHDDASTAGRVLHGCDAHGGGPLELISNKNKNIDQIIQNQNLKTRDLQSEL